MDFLGKNHRKSQDVQFSSSFGPLLSHLDNLKVILFNLLKSNFLIYLEGLESQQWLFLWAPKVSVHSQVSVHI